MTLTRLASIVASSVTVLFVTAGPGSVHAASPAAAPAQRSTPDPLVSTNTLRGTVTDDRGRGIVGVLVSAAGEQTAVAVTDGTGRFVFSGLPAGPYLIRVHQRGYVQARAELVQALAGETRVVPIRLTAMGSPRLLIAGVGGDAAVPPDPDGHDHGELSWRLRHSPRGALDEVSTAVDPGRDEASAFLEALRLPFLPFLSLSGELNLLTATSLDTPERFFVNRAAPNGVAHLTLASPAPGGEWRMRGALTQGDLSAWMAAGAYARTASATHAYESGASFTRQRYDGGNAAALAAIGDGGRVAGSLYAFDHWRIGRATFSYGGRYDRYDFLPTRGLLSPRADVMLDAGRGLRLRGAVSLTRRAPGAEEFAVPESFSLGLPPARTFSAVSSDGAFRTEGIRHYEAGLEQALPGGVSLGGRLFAQRVDDQMVAVFGVDSPGGAASRTGHYLVGGAGDYTARGFGVSAAREIGEHVTGSIDYALSRATWMNDGADRAVLRSLASQALRAAREQVSDLTTSVNAEIPMTATRVIVVYRINQASAVDDGTSDLSGQLSGRRFDVQIQQALPFLRFTNAQWAALFAIQSRVRDAQFYQSVYDELLSLRAPKRLVGGLTVRF